MTIAQKIIDHFNIVTLFAGFIFVTCGILYKELIYGKNKEKMKKEYEMSKKTKLVSYVLALLLLINVTGNLVRVEAKSIKEVSVEGSILLNEIKVSNTSNNNVKMIEDKYNLKDVKDISKENNILSLDYEFGKLDQGQVVCTVKGIMKINGISEHFTAQGRLYLYNSTNGDDIYTGGLVGRFDGATIFETDKIISLSLNYNATSNRAYIPVAIGAFGDDNKMPVMVEFGEYFSEINQAVGNMKAAMEKSSTVSTLNGNDSVSIAPLAANVTQYGLSTGTGAYNGKTVIYHSYYGTKEAVPSGSFLGKVRTQVHLNNFISAYNATLPAYNGNNPYSVYTSINHYVTDIWLNYTTNKTNNRITDPMPAAFSSTFSLRYPSFLIPYGALNYVLSYITLSIPLNGVSHSYNSTYNTLQTKMWKGSGMSEVVTNSTSPYGTQTGLANNFLIFNSMNAGTSCTATTSASAQIFFEDVQVDAYCIPRWVVVSSSSSIATLKSVN